MTSSMRGKAMASACVASIAVGMIEVAALTLAHGDMSPDSIARSVAFAVASSALVGFAAGICASVQGGGAARGVAWSLGAWALIALVVRAVPWNSTWPAKLAGVAAAFALAVLCLRVVARAAEKLPVLASSRTWSAVLVVALAVVGVTAFARRAEDREIGANAAQRPSILFVTIDTLRADFVGCFGRAQARTPALDELAAHGVLFEHAQTHTLLTGPSHATMLTGLLPIHSGLTENLQRLSSRVPTIVEQLSRLGYETGAFVGGYPLKQDASAMLARFQTYDDDFRSWRALPRESANLVLGRVLWNVLERRGVDLEPRYRPASAVADVAIPWLEARSSQPFFAWVHFFDPHLPYEPPADFLSERARAYHGPARGDWSRMSAREQAQLIEDPAAMEQMNELYDAEVASTDAQLARVISAARAHSANGLWIVVTADHGENFGEHGIYFERDLYEESLHVPLIVAMPQALDTGRRVATPVGLIDLAPTLLEIAGGKLDGDGHSLMPLLRGEAWPKHAYLAEIFTSTGIPYRRASYAVREDSWKLIVRHPGFDNSPFRWKPGDERELYDVDRDPREQRDLAEPEKARIDALQARALELHKVHVADPLKLSPDELAALRQLGYTH